MTAQLLREAADRLETISRRYWDTNPNRIDCETRPPFCSLCHLDMPEHKPGCLIDRLRTAADQMEKVSTFAGYPTPIDLIAIPHPQDGKEG